MEETPNPKRIKTKETTDEVDILQYLNEKYRSKDFIKTVKEQYNETKNFRHAKLQNFLDEEFLVKVKEELFNEINEEDWNPKNNDLYTFIQSNDLKHSEKKYVKQFKEIIYSKEFRNFLESVTDIELNNTIDLFASRYWAGHHLLCHDDELEGRRIAFIFYFVPKDWSKEDGGTLDFFDVNEDGQPDRIFKSTVPEWNSFLFFEISPTSFHQVAEVLKEDRERLAVSGWFHGRPIKRPPPFIEPPLNKSLLKENDSIKLSDWIDPSYLEEKNQKQIRKVFVDSCTIELKEFFLKSKYEELEKALLSEDIPWSYIGPYNRRHYETLGKWEVKHEFKGIIKEFNDLFHSKTFADLLKKLTNLDLLNVHSEIRKFRSGSYTLSQDNQDQIDEYGLDLYYFICENDTWDVDVGGHIVYMGEDEELATIIPEKNSLSLVFRDKGCMKFVKYVNAQGPGARHEFAVTYWEDPNAVDNDDRDNEEEEEDPYINGEEHKEEE